MQELLEAIKTVGFPIAVGAALIVHFIYMNKWLSGQVERLQQNIESIRDSLSDSEKATHAISQLQEQNAELHRRLEHEQRESRSLLENLLSTARSDEDRRINISTRRDSERMSFVELEGYALAQFRDRNILDEANIHGIHESIREYLRTSPHKKLVLDFYNVDHLSSAALGTLFSIHNFTRKLNGRIVLSRIEPQIFEVFKITRSNKLFEICATLQEASEIMRRELRPASKVTLLGDSADGQPSVVDVKSLPTQAS